MPFSLCAPALFAGLEDEGTAKFNSAEDAFDAIKQIKSTRGADARDYVVFHTTEGKFIAEPAEVGTDETTGNNYLYNPMTKETRWVNYAEQTWVPKDEDLSDPSAFVKYAKTLASRDSRIRHARADSGATEPSVGSTVSPDSEDDDDVSPLRASGGSRPGGLLRGLQTPSELLAAAVGEDEGATPRMESVRPLPRATTVGDLAASFPDGVKVKDQDVSAFVRQVARAFDSAKKADRLLYMQALRSLETLSDEGEAHPTLSPLVKRIQDELYEKDRFTTDQINADESPEVFRETGKRLKTTTRDMSLLGATAVGTLSQALVAQQKKAAQEAARSKRPKSARTSPTKPSGIFDGMDVLDGGADAEDTPEPSPAPVPRSKQPVDRRMKALRDATQELQDASEAQVRMEQADTDNNPPLGTTVRKALQDIWEHTKLTQNSLNKKVEALQKALADLDTTTLLHKETEGKLATLEEEVRNVARFTGDEGLLATPLRTRALTAQLDKKIAALKKEIDSEEVTATKETRWLPGKRDAKLRAEARKAALETQLAALEEFKKRTTSGKVNSNEIAEALSAVQVIATRDTDEETRKLATELFRAKRAEAYSAAQEAGASRRNIPFPTTAKGEAERKKLAQDAMRDVEEKFRKLAADDNMIKQAKLLLAKQTENFEAFSRFQIALAGMEASGAKKKDSLDDRLAELRQTQAVLYTSLLKLTSKVAGASDVEQRAQQLLADHLRLRNADLQKRITDLEAFQAEQIEKAVPKKLKQAKEKLAAAGYEVTIEEPTPVVATPVTPRPRSSMSKPEMVVVETAEIARLSKERRAHSRSIATDNSRLLATPAILDLSKSRSGSTRAAFVERDRSRSRSPEPRRERDTAPFKLEVIGTKETAPERSRSRKRESRAPIPVLTKEKRRAQTELFEKSVRSTAKPRRGDSPSGRSNDTRVSQFTADSTDISGRSRSPQAKPSSRPSTSYRPEESARFSVSTARSKMAGHGTTNKAAQEAREKTAQAEARIREIRRRR